MANKNNLTVKKNAFDFFRSLPRELKANLKLYRESSGLVIPKTLFDLYAFVHRFGSEYYKLKAREFMAKMGDETENDEFDETDLDLIYEMLRGYDEVCNDLERFLD